MKKFIKYISIFCFIIILSIPSFASKTNPYEIVNNNIPYFDTKDLSRTDAFETYSNLDSLGRCGVAYANICQELMPNSDREGINTVYPSGWKYQGKSNNNKYAGLVDGNYIYNRCHLIAFCLAGENANKKNLITGTRSLNIQGMYEFEEDVLAYVKKTGNHVLYRVTPEFKNEELICRSVLMEGYSVEDDGEGICYCIRAWNNEDGIIIDYSTGRNWKTEDAPDSFKTSSETTSTNTIEEINTNDIEFEEDDYIEDFDFTTDDISIDDDEIVLKKSTKTTKNKKEKVETINVNAGTLTLPAIILVILVLWLLFGKHDNNPGGTGTTGNYNRSSSVFDSFNNGPSW